MFFVLLCSSALAFFVFLLLILQAFVQQEGVLIAGHYEFCAVHDINDDKRQNAVGKDEAHEIANNRYNDRRNEMENTNDEQEHTAKDDDFCSGLNGRRVTIEKSGYSIVDFGEDVISLFAIVIIVSIAAIISRTAAAIAASPYPLLPLL